MANNLVTLFTYYNNLILSNIPCILGIRDIGTFGTSSGKVVTISEVTIYNALI